MMIFSLVVLSDLANDELESGAGRAGDGGPDPGDLGDLLLLRTPRRDPL